MEWESTISRRVIQQITKQYDRSGCWTVSSSQIKIGSYVKPGGTGTLTWGRSTGALIDRGTDPWNMGRWSYDLIAGRKEGHTLLLITGYRTGPRIKLG